MLTPEQLQLSVYCSQRNVTTTSSLASGQSSWICKNFTSSKIPKSVKHPVFKNSYHTGEETHIKWSANFYVFLSTCACELRSEVEPTKLDTSCSSCCFLIPFLFHFLIPQFLWSAMTQNDRVSLLWTTGPKGKSSVILNVCLLLTLSAIW